MSGVPDTPSLVETIRVNWPFVGRTAALDVLGRLYRGARSHGVLLEGPAGVGKTRLADAFLTEFESADGVVALRCVAAAATQHVPFSAVANLLPDSVLRSTHFEPMRVLAAVRDAHRDRRIVLMVDDVVFLDEPSMALCSQLIARGELFIIGTRRDEQRIPTMLDGIIRSFDLARLDVQPLGVDAVAAAAEHALACDLDPSTMRRLAERSGGNPLYVRELLLDAATSGAIITTPSGRARLELVGATGPRLVELVTSRLASLAEELVPILRTIAVAEPVWAEDLDRSELATAAAALEREGWLRVDQRDSHSEVRIAHPLHGEVIKASMGVLEHRRHTALAAELIRSRPTPHVDDPLRIALWELDAGLRPERSVLLEGARRARAAVDLSSTLRLARAAHDLEPSTDTNVLMVEVLFLMGRFAEAEDLAAQPLPDDIDLTVLVSHIMVRMDNLLWGLGRPALAEAVVESYRPRLASLGLDSLLDNPLAFIAANDGRSAAATAMLGPVPDNPLLFLLSSVARINAADHRGSYAEVRRCCTRALEMLAGLPDPRGSVDPRFYVLSECVADLGLGDFDAAYERCVDTHASILDDRATFLRCFVGILAGLSALGAGRLTDADRWFTETEAVVAGLPLPAALRVARAGRASVAGQRGDTTGARSALELLDATSDEMHWMYVATASGRAWAQRCLGLPVEARLTMRAAAEWAIAADEPVEALQALVESCRHGDGDWASGQLDRIAGLAAVEGPLAAAHESFVSAHGRRGPEPMDQAARSLAMVGSHLLAAEAATSAAARFDRDGLRRDGQRSRALAADSLARCQGAMTPGVRDTAAVVPLTDREREIALLAAEGLTSKLIAERLHLSTRTVDNHLQRVFTKLGVSRRDELTQQFDNE